MDDPTAHPPVTPSWKGACSRASTVAACHTRSKRRDPTAHLGVLFMAPPLRPFWAVTHPAFHRCRGRRLLTLARGSHPARVLGWRRLRPKKKRRLPAAGDADAARRADAPRGRENIAQGRVGQALAEERTARR